MPLNPPGAPKMNPMNLTQPYFDEDDAGGAAAPATPVADTGAQATTPEQPTAPVNSDPLGVEEARRSLAVANLNTALAEKDERIAALEAKLDTIIASTTKNVVKAAQGNPEDVPPEIENDPAYKLLKATAARLEALEKSQQAALERQSTFDKQAKTTHILATEKRLVSEWVEKQVIPADPAIVENPVIAEALRHFATNWVNKEFDPNSDIPTQEAQLRIDMGAYLTQLKAKSGTVTKREAALAVDAAAKSNLSAGQAARPGLATPEKNPFNPKTETESWLKWKTEQRYKAFKEQRAVAGAAS